MMLFAFFEINGVVHHEFIPPGQTVNGHFYVQIERCGLEETMRQVAKRVVSASQQRTKPHIACAAIPCQEKNSYHHPTTVLSRSCSE
jgi:hypothetical protein